MTPTLWLNAGVALGGAITLVFLANAARHLRRLRLLRGSLHGLGGLFIGCLAALAMLVGVNLLTYARFTAEQPVGSIRFHQLAPQRFAVTLTLHDGRTIHARLAGDEWQVDARMLKWSGLATAIGFKPLYRLQRLSGRYTSISEEQTRPHTAVALTQKTGISIWHLARSQASWLPFIDAFYGTATFLPMHDGAVYRIRLSVTGLLARPANSAARRATESWEAD